jgi:hypothetical protein
VIQLAQRMPHPIRTFPPPRNGEKYVVMIAGGHGDMYRDLRRTLEASRPAVVPYHAERMKDFGKPIPADVDLIVILINYCGHGKSEKIVEQAKTRGIPVLPSTHKWAQLSMRLDGLGFPKQIDVQVNRRPVKVAVEFRNPVPVTPTPIVPPPEALAVPVETEAERAERAAKVREQEQAELRELEEQIRAMELEEAAAKLNTPSEDTSVEDDAQDEALVAEFKRAFPDVEPAPVEPPAELSLEELVRALAKAMKREHVDEVNVKFTSVGKALVTISEPGK